MIEFARNVLKMKDAHSTEMNPKTKHAVIDMMEEQKRFRKKVELCDWVVIPAIYLKAQKH